VKRRHFLAGLAGLSGGLLLPRLGGARTPRPLSPKRLVLLVHNNGVQQANFWPTTGFTSPILDPILSVPRLAARTTVVRGVYVTRDANNTDANEHDMGFIRMWTGAPIYPVAGHPWGGATSVDQLVAQASGSPSLTAAVLASSLQSFPKPGFQHRRSFSYLSAGVHKVPTLDPFVAYADLFWGGEQLTDQAKRKLSLRKSALDAATADLATLRAKVGGDESRKLDAHADALRTVELRLADRLAGKLGPGATCSAKGAPPRDFTDTALDKLISDESLVPELVRDHLDLMVAAFACNLTQVATLQLGYCGGHWNADWANVSQDHHDTLAHKDTADEGVDPVVTAKLVSLDRWYAQQVAYLAKRLDAIPEGNGTVLDHTLIAWTSEFGRGDHSLDNVPVVLLGGVIPSGGFVDVGRQTFQRVGTTVLRAMGQQVSGFGDAPYCGPLDGVPGV
jgi:hypothetical protein